MRVGALLAEFFRFEAIGGLLLLCAAVLAFICANTPVLDSWYLLAFHQPLIGHEPLVEWINDGFMAFFFLLVGLEIKREVLANHTSSPRDLILPAIGALGGVVLPALIYIYFNRGEHGTLGGWAIPTATDIAFSLAIFLLVGKRLPNSLRLFLSSLAIFDDLVAVVIIAVVFSTQISLLYLALSAAVLCLLLVFSKKQIGHLGIYVSCGFLLWFFLIRSGVHGSLAGVFLALCIPTVDRRPGHSSPLERLEHLLNPWVAFAILPLFAFANAGVSLTGVTWEMIRSPVSWGVICGLFFGKQLGIFSACFLAIKAKLARLPAGASWSALYGTSIVCGVGFTMSLFVGTLAFAEVSPLLVLQVKLGILCGSLLAGIAGYLWLRFLVR